VACVLGGRSKYHSRYSQRPRRSLASPTSHLPTLSTRSRQTRRSTQATSFESFATLACGVGRTNSAACSIQPTSTSTLPLFRRSESTTPETASTGTSRSRATSPPANTWFANAIRRDTPQITTEAPATTVAQPTTTDLAVSPVPPGSSAPESTTPVLPTVDLQAGGGQLPATGSDTPGLLPIGTAAVIAGASLVAAHRRRPTPQAQRTNNS
jgi:LPXTG-motif cell wall-anchored protein